MANLFVRAYKYITRNTRLLLYSNRYYNWYVFSRSLSRRWNKTMLSHYTSDEMTPVEGCLKTVVFLCNGFVEHGGWADRLKGILSTFAVCKEQNIPFRLLFNSPFPLTDYLVPNGYNWTIPEQAVIYDTSCSDIVALEIGNETDWQGKKQYKYLKKKITSSSAQQVHVCTNAHFCYNRNFSSLFHELFRTAPRLQAAIDRCREQLKDDYVSVSARFINSLGDFIDTQKAPPLPPNLRQQLLQRCVQQVQNLHEQYPNSKILVCSDSTTFLSAVRDFPYIYIYEGHILHFDTPSASADYALYEKTFVDFFLIAGASAVYRLETRWIRQSGFPYAASQVFDRPFIPIKF